MVADVWTHQTVHIKYVQFSAYELYFNIYFFKIADLAPIAAMSDSI